MKKDDWIISNATRLEFLIVHHDTDSEGGYFHVKFEGKGDVIVLDAEDVNTRFKIKG